MKGKQFSAKTCMLCRAVSLAFLLLHTNRLVILPVYYKRAALTGSFSCCVLQKDIQGQKKQCELFQLNAVTTSMPSVCCNALIFFNNSVQLLLPGVLAHVVQQLTHSGSKSALGISADNYFLIIKYSVKIEVFSSCFHTEHI